MNPLPYEIAAPAESMWIPAATIAGAVVLAGLLFIAIHPLGWTIVRWFLWWRVIPLSWGHAGGWKERVFDCCFISYVAIERHEGREAAVKAGADEPLLHRLGIRPVEHFKGREEGGRK